jgi:ribosome biogenesis GTPase
MKDSPLPDDASVDDRRLARVERVLRTLGKSDLDEVDVDPGQNVGRVSIVHGSSAQVIWCDNDGREHVSTCQYATNLHLRPVAGDWVALRDEYVVSVLTRRNALRRPDPNLRDVQILAANLDLVLLVVPIDRGLNVRMLERFAVMAFDSGARPLVVLTKADGTSDATALEIQTELAVPGVDILTTSSMSGEGIEQLRQLLHEGVTAVMLGASGAGKTSLLNALEGSDEATLSVGSSGEGRHATTTRKLYRLSSGGVLLDIPGIRLVDLMSGQEGIDETFADITRIAERCRFRDCAHNGDEGCAVEAAVISGELPASRLKSWRLIQSQITSQSRRRDPSAAATKRARRRRSGD